MELGYLGFAGETYKTLSAKKTMGYYMYLYREHHATPANEQMPDASASAEAQVWPEYPTMVRETIGKWWKAYQIHGWIVDNVCKDSDIPMVCDVSRSELAKLLEVVDEVLNASELVSGRMSLGYSPTDEGKVHFFKDGKLIADPRVAKRLLPVGGNDPDKLVYDQYYIDQLEAVKTALQAALASPAHMRFSYAMS